MRELIEMLTARILDVMTVLAAIAGAGCCVCDIELALALLAAAAVTGCTSYCLDPFSGEEKR